MEQKNTTNAETNTNPYNNIGIINAGNLKKKPHNITIKNFNPNEPKTRQSRFYIVISKITADTKLRLNQNYIVKL